MPVYDTGLQTWIKPWCYGGGDPGPIRPVSGWTGGVNCSPVGLPYSVSFSQDVTFTSHAGVKFVNITTGETAGAVASSTVSPARTIQYTMTWVTAPVSGDVVEFQYTAAQGNYQDADSNAMADQTQQLSNCADAPVFTGNIANQNVNALAAFNLDVSSEFGGTPTSYSLGGTWPAGFSISAAGVITWTGPVENKVYSNLTVSAHRAGFPDAVSNTFTLTVATTAIVFSGPVPDQTFIVNQAYSHDYSQYFSGTIESYSLGGTWPAGFSIDNAGVVTGTSTAEASYPGLTVTASNTLPDSAISNTFSGTASTQVQPDALLAAPDGSNKMQMVVTGTGPGTSTHTATIYAKDYLNVYRPFGANKPVWEGGRYVDEDNVFSDGGPTEMPYLKYQPAATNSLVESRTFLASAWNSANVTKTANLTGLDGTTNTGWRLDDTGASKEYMQSGGVGSGGAKITAKWWIGKDTDTARFPVFYQSNASVDERRVMLNTQTGAHATPSDGTAFDAIEVVDDGDYWIVLATVDSITEPNRIGLNPAYTDAWGGAVNNALTGGIDCYQIESHSDKTIDEVRGLGPIFTGASAASTDQIIYKADGNEGVNTATWYAEYMPLSDPADSSIPMHHIVNGSGGTPTNGGLIMRVESNRITHNPSFASVTWAVDTMHKVGAVSHAGENKGVANVNGTYGSENVANSNNRDGLILYPNAGAVYRIRNIRRYDNATFQDGKDIIDGLMI